MRYLPGRALPDKAVSILDLGRRAPGAAGAPEVTAESVAEVVAELADMPVERLLESDGDRMLRLEEILGRTCGRARRSDPAHRSHLAAQCGYPGSRRPIGTFLLLGPTGVGKTETAKAVAGAFSLRQRDDARGLVGVFGAALDRSLGRGAPPGYVGHEAGGQLTEEGRMASPVSRILLDELEKAHLDVLTSFLGVFDEARLTDGRGRRVDFTNTVILMTSNLGAEETGSSPRRRVGFGNDAQDRADLGATRDRRCAHGAWPPSSTTGLTRCS